MNEMTVSLYELNKTSGAILKKAQSQEVVVESHGKPIAVIISYDQYMKMKKRKKAA